MPADPAKNAARRVAMPVAWLFALGLAATADEPKSAEVTPLPKMATEVAFPNLKFDRPVVMAEPGDGKGLLFVVEQNGVISSFPDDPSTSDKKTFLDIRKRVNREGNEEGLLGLAFHPKYKENGEFFVYYSAMNPGYRRSVVSRFRVSKDDPRRADPAGEEPVWVSTEDPFGNHNGGCILFGPDGMLYITLGDSGAGGDPLTTGQNPKDWFGSILRIDVDHPSDGRAYGIPSDNPARRSKAHAHWAPEVYCIGLRNVWKFSFDREGGTLWAGDVGQDLWEMVHIIKNGGNYGWSVAEGLHPFKPRQKADKASPISKPLVDYPHDRRQDKNRTDVGKSITGGYVYRGQAHSELGGLYIYGDFDSGRIWGLRERDGKSILSGELTEVDPSKKLNISAFGEDAKGELYILAFDGKIHRLVPRS